MDHPAADFLRHKQLFAGCELPADFACDPKFYGELVAIFKSALPLVRYLNTALTVEPAKPFRYF